MINLQEQKILSIISGETEDEMFLIGKRRLMQKLTGKGLLSQNPDGKLVLTSDGEVVLSESLANPPPYRVGEKQPGDDLTLSQLTVGERDVLVLCYTTIFQDSQWSRDDRVAIKTLKGKYDLLDGPQPLGGRAGDFYRTGYKGSRLARRILGGE